MICGELSAVVGFREELYVKDRYVADEFNMTTLKMNATLNEERTIYLDKDNALLKDLKCLEEYAR